MKANETDISLIEKVKTVAIFAGWKEIAEPPGTGKFVWLEKSEPDKKRVLYKDSFGNVQDITNEIRYHWDLNWMLQVMDKIKDLDDGYIFQIRYPHSCAIYDAWQDRVPVVMSHESDKGTMNIFNAIYKFISTRNDTR